MDSEHHLDLNSKFNTTFSLSKLSKAHLTILQDKQEVNLLKSLTTKSTVSFHYGLLYKGVIVCNVIEIMMNLKVLRASL